MMSAVGVVTQVGADVSSDVAEPVRGTGEPVCEMSRVQVGSAGAGEKNCLSEFRCIPGHSRFHVRAGGMRAVQRPDSLH